MSKLYQLRVDLQLTGVTVEQVLKVIQDIPHILVTEVGKETGKLHCNALLRTDLTLSAIRKKVKKGIPVLKGNEMYSLQDKTKMKEIWMRYIFKGTIRTFIPDKLKEVVNVISITMELQKTPYEWHTEYYKVLEDVKERKEERKKQHKEMKDLVLERVARKILVEQKVDTKDIRNLGKVIVESIYEVCEEMDRLLPDDTLTIKYIEYVYMKFHYQKGQDDKIRRIMDRLTPRSRNELEIDTSLPPEL